MSANQRKGQSARTQIDSEDQFTELIHSLGWEIDTPENDYGEDFWIRVFKDGSPTGDVLYVQLKGAADLDNYKLKKGAYYSYSAEIVHLVQWFSVIIPVYFVLWDVTKRYGYWLDVQTFITSKLEDDPQWFKIPNSTRQIYIPQSHLVSVENKEAFLVNLQNTFTNLRTGQQTHKRLEQIVAVHTTPETLSDALIEAATDFATLAPAARSTQQKHKIALIEAELRQSPTDANLWTEKALYLYELNDFDEALVAINKAWDINHQDINIAWGRGCIFAEYAIAHGGKPRSLLYQAIDMFNLSKDSVSAALLHYNIGNSLSALHEYVEAISRFNEALSNNPPPKLESQIWKNRGSAYYHLGNHDEEISSYKKAVELDNNRWEAYASWALTESFLGNYEQAIDLFQKARQCNPHFNDDPNLLYSLAYARWKADDYITALTEVEDVLSHIPNHEDGIMLKAYLLMYLWRDNPHYVPQAIKFYESMLLDNPDHLMAKSELHLLYYGQDEYDKARRLIEELVTQENVPAKVYYDYAQFLESEGKIDNAIEQLERATSISPEHHYVHKLGHLYQGKHDFPNAIKNYRLALAEVDDPIHILQEIADCHYQLGEYKECTRLMLQLILLDPENQRSWTNLAVSLQLQNKFYLYDELEGVTSAIEVVEATKRILSAL